MDRHLKATEGMVLTNGNAFAVELWLGEGDSADNWREITKEEAAALMVDENSDHEIE